MAKSFNYTINIKILDYWLEDTYELGKSYVCYILMKINDRLKLIQRDMK